MEFFKDFGDEFLLATTLIVAFLVSVDWLIGEKKRQSMRDSLGMWWLHIEEISYKGLVKEDAKIILNLFQAVVGEKFFSPRSLVASPIISFLITFPAIVCVVWMVKGSEEIFGWMSGSQIIIKYTIPVNAFFDWLSIIATMWLLRKMSQTDSASNLLGIALFDIILVLVFGILTSTLSHFFIRLEAGGLDNALAFEHYISLVWDTVLLKSDASGALTAHYVYLVTSITAALPTILHFCLLAIFIGSKLFKPVVQVLIGIPLVRFAESSKGPLALVSIFIGVCAKLIQQWDKLNGSV